MSVVETTRIVHKFVTSGAASHTQGMATHSLILLRPRERSFTARLADSVRDTVAEVVEFERNHARLAWCTTLVGVVIGLALQALG